MDARERLLQIVQDDPAVAQIILKGIIDSSSDESVENAYNAVLLARRKQAAVPSNVLVGVGQLDPVKAASKHLLHSD